MQVAVAVLAGVCGFLLGGVIVFLFFLIGWIKIYTIGGGDTYESYREGEEQAKAAVRKISDMR